MKGTKKGVKIPSAGSVSPAGSIKIWLLPLLIVITIIVYQGSLDNGLTNWDDNINLTENADLLSYQRGSIWPQIASYFKVRNDMVMYEPITKTCYLLQYSMCQLEPKPYHTVNLILHLLNCLLVFYVIWLLCRHQWVAFIAALLFAIHPMHVEPVAWVTGLIDLLYSLFYLAALCTYILYLRNEKWKWSFYIITLGLFAMSLFSKASAVTLPAALLLIDYFLDRKVTFKNQLDKIPFIIPALIFGCIAIYAQQKNAIPEGLSHSGLIDRILFTCYALTAYLYKLLAPLNLSCFYAYPSKHASGLFAGRQMYPLLVLTAPLVLTAIALLIYYSGRHRKDVLLGFGFFLINVMLVLPGVAKRNTIMADRYTYIAYTGLFFMAARWLVNLWESRNTRFQRLRIPALVSLVFFLVACGYLSAGRCEVWHDSISLWTDAIEKDPGLELAYVNRGDIYLAQNRLDEALKDYEDALSLKPDDPDAYYNRGNAYCSLNKYETGIQDYTMAVRYKPNYTKAFVNRGNAYCVLKKYDLAIPDYTSAISISPKNGMYHNNRASAYFSTGRFQSAMEDITIARQEGFYVDTAFVRSIQMNLERETRR